MSLYNGPPRGGTRGGKDQFSWDAVKADKDREYYLGHSVKATTGRWQKGKDVFWYTREKQDNGDAARAELLAVKQREEDLMAEALGIKPKTIRAPKQPSLDQKDLQQLMQKEEDEEAAEGGDREAERIKGLGFTVNAVRGAGDAEHDVLPGTVPAGGPPQPGGGTGGALPPPPQLSADDAKRLRKAQKQAAKEARRAMKKEEKKAKKALKKAKKLAKKAKVEQQQQQQQPDRPEASSSSDSGRSDSSQPESNAEDRHGEAGPGGRRALEDANTATGHGSRPRQESPPSPHRQPLKRRRAEDDDDDRQGRRHGDTPARQSGRAEGRHAQDRSGSSPSRRPQRRRSPEHRPRRS